MGISESRRGTLQVVVGHGWNPFVQVVHNTRLAVTPAE